LPVFGEEPLVGRPCHISLQLGCCYGANRFTPVSVVGLSSGVKSIAAGSVRCELVECLHILFILVLFSELGQIRG
jgi:hypothetical protein